MRSGDFMDDMALDELKAKAIVDRVDGLNKLISDTYDDSNLRIEFEVVNKHRIDRGYDCPILIVLVSRCLGVSHDIGGSDAR